MTNMCFRGHCSKHLPLLFSTFSPERSAFPMCSLEVFRAPPKQCPPPPVPQLRLFLDVVEPHFPKMASQYGSLSDPASARHGSCTAGTCNLSSRAASAKKHTALASVSFVSREPGVNIYVGMLIQADSWPAKGDYQSTTMPNRNLYRLMTADPRPRDPNIDRPMQTYLPTTSCKMLDRVHVDYPLG